jgi:hypothetical protein
MIEFTDDDEFHRWCEQQQDDGFFVGYAPGYPPQRANSSTNIPRMHRARCSTVPLNTVGRYRKCGSTDRSELEARFKPAGLQYCLRCKP